MKRKILMVLMLLVLLCGCGNSIDGDDLYHNRNPKEDIGFEGNFVNEDNSVSSNVNNGNDVSEKEETEKKEQQEEKTQIIEAVKPTGAEFLCDLVETSIDGATKVRFSYYPQDADLTKYPLSIYCKTDGYAFVSQIEIEQDGYASVNVWGCCQGTTDLIISFDDWKASVPVVIDKRTYSLETIDSGYFYTSGDKIYKFNDDTYNISKEYSKYAWVDATDFNDDTFPTIHVGDTIYAKGDSSVAMNLIGLSYESHPGERSGRQPSGYWLEDGSYWGYTYDCRTIYTGFNDVSIYSVRDDSHQTIYSTDGYLYVNGKEYWGVSEYLDEVWNEYEYTLVITLGTLEKDDRLTIGAFSGTEYKEMETVANIWAVAWVDEITKVFTMTRDGYMYLTIPESWPSAYYCLKSYIDSEEHYYWFYLDNQYKK